MHIKEEREGNQVENYKIRTLNFIKEKYNETKAYKQEYITSLKELVNRGDLKICLFGCGFLGKGFYYDFLDFGIKIEYFCDNNPNKWGKTIEDDVECISPCQLKELSKKENILVVLSLGKVDEVYNQLMALNVNQIIKHPFDLFATNQNNWIDFSQEEIVEKVEKLYEILGDEDSKKVAFGLITAMFMKNNELNQFSYLDIYSNDIYIPRNIVQLKKGECIVDGGSFNGDTLSYFLEKIKYSDFRKYFCFELNRNNVYVLNKRLEMIDETIRNKVVVLNKGISDQSGEVYYRNSTSSSCIADNDGILGECVALDDLLTNEHVSYIKMDIEGSEMLAIKGAKNIIKEEIPTCAISIYHKASDVWEIPLLLKEIAPGYRIFLRHHESMQAESLCYAVK